MQASIQSMSPEEHEAIRTAARLQFQHFRALGSGPVRQRARLLAASGRLSDADLHTEGVTVLANDNGSVGRVRLIWTDTEAGRCSCSAFARRATCPHVIGLLDAVIAALGGSVKSSANSGPESSPSSEAVPASLDDQRWLERLEHYREVLEAERSSAPSPWEAPFSSNVEVRYLLRLVDRRGGPVAQLEAQIRQHTANGDAAALPWKSIPFSDGDRSARRSRSGCLLYTSPSPRDQRGSRMPSSA